MIQLPIQKSRLKSYDLINDLAKDLGHPGEKEKAKILLIAVLHIWRNKLPIDNAIQVLTNLPPFLKEIFIHQWTPSQNPESLEKFNLAEELSNYLQVHSPYQIAPQEAEKVVFKVFINIEKTLEKQKMMFIKTFIPCSVKSSGFISVYKAA